MVQGNVTNATGVDYPAQNKKSPQEEDNSPPMAVLPLNPSAKLDQEPNPFEQSFSSVAVSEKSETKPATCDSLSSSSSSSSSNSSNSSNSSSSHKPVLPPVAAITSPVPPLLRSGVLPKDVANQIAWNSLRAGPLSPSMLQGPANPSDFGIMPPYSSVSQQQQRPTSHIYAADPALSFAMAGPADEPAPAYGRSSSMSSSASVPSISSTATSQAIKQEDQDTKMIQDTKEARKKRTRPSNEKDEDEEKRKNFLERNRIAALKCRQRKKQWLNNLQAKVEYLTNDNEQLQMQANALREEIVNLKTLLLAHKDCPVAQQQQAAAYNSNTGIQKSSMIHPSPAEPTSSTSSNGRMQQSMMTFSSHPQTQGMVAGTSGVLRF
ncbi:hypothetical protein BJV82DRAFT_631241 [Fennellomyces sp. T-0311]|nr:hypothetical protein BJV82DRAFT_631241 [Fennellomyces sp. T-0311]